MPDSNERRGDRRVTSPNDIVEISKVADRVWEAYLSSAERENKYAVIKSHSESGQLHCLVDPRLAITWVMADAWERTGALTDDDNLSAEEQLDWDRHATMLVGKAATEHSMKLFGNLLPHVLQWSFGIARVLHFPMFMSESSHKRAIQRGEDHSYVRRQVGLSAFERITKNAIKRLGDQLARIAFDTAQDLKTEFDLEVLNIYNRTLEACRLIKKKARPFTEARRKGSRRRDNSAEWDAEYAALEIDLPHGIELEPHEFLTKQPSEIALRAVADFLNIPETTLKTRLLPGLRKSKRTAP